MSQRRVQVCERCGNIVTVQPQVIAGTRTDAVVWPAVECCGAGMALRRRPASITDLGTWHETIRIKDMVLKSISSPFDDETRFRAQRTVALGGLPPAR